MVFIQIQIIQNMQLKKKDIEKLCKKLDINFNYYHIYII